MTEKQFQEALAAIEDELSLLREHYDRLASAPASQETEKSLAALSASYDRLTDQLARLDDGNARHLSALHAQLSQLGKEFISLKKGMRVALEDERLPRAVTEFERRLSHLEAGLEASFNTALSHHAQSLSKHLTSHRENGSVQDRAWLEGRLSGLSEMQESVRHLRQSHEKNASALADLNHRLFNIVGVLAEQRKISDQGISREKQLEHLALALEDKLDEFEKTVERHSSALKSMDLSLGLLRSSMEASVEKVTTHHTSVHATSPLHGSHAAPHNPHAPLTPNDNASAYEPQFRRLFETLESQKESLRQIQSAMPYSNQFEEVIKHADLVEQHTQEKLEGIQRALGTQSQSLTGLTGELTQLPALMRGLSDAISGVSANLEKHQATFNSLQRQLSEQLEASARHSLHTSPSPLHVQTDSLTASHVRELKESFTLQQRQLSETLSNLQFQLEQLSGLSRGLSSLSKPAAPSESEAALKSLLASQQTALSVMQQQLSELLARNASASTPAQEWASLRSEIQKLSASLKAQPESQKVDFTPVMNKLDELRFEFWFSPEQSRPKTATESTVLQNPASHRQVLGQIREELGLFKQFELSDRAQLALERLDALVIRGLSLSETQPPSLSE